MWTSAAALTAEPSTDPTFSADDLHALRALGREQRFLPGWTLSTASARKLLLIERGFVKVVEQRGGRETVLSVHGPGEHLGEIALVDRVDRAHTIVALTGGHAVHLPASSLWRLLDLRPELNRTLIMALTARLGSVAQQQADDALTPAVARIAGRVLWLADRFGTERGAVTVIDIPLAQADLASWAGMSRESGVRALRQLRDAGWIRVEQRRIIVIDRAALDRYAHDPGRGPAADPRAQRTQPAPLALI
ncbi:hypothetical protein DSM112329_01867 [Paraconexibacter sp. AEG42_29]|uniref:Crp/Fnr family transcriptional regulator n=1 Tax=Paraconexibacter sp. AEG42_29 TaxID=2997339 RepID=A0AAU7ATL1_9ACTN